MQTTNITIWILSVLNVALLTIMPLLDRQWYGDITKPAMQHFFCDPVYDNAVNRFMLSKGGLIIMALSIMTMPFLAKFNHGA